MKTVLAGISIIVLSYIAQLFTPWWIIVPICAIVTYVFKLSYPSAFLVSFLALALQWGILMGIINMDNNSILADKIGVLLGGLSPILVIVIAAVMVGFIGGLSGLLGRSIRELT